MWTDRHTWTDTSENKTFFVNIIRGNANSHIILYAKLQRWCLMISILVQLV